MKPLIVVDAPKRFPLQVPGAELVSAQQYLTEPRFAQGKGRKVFNLCRSLRYQAAGYYVSLLAEARGHRCLPSVSAIQDLRMAPMVRLIGDDLDELVQRSLRRLRGESFELSVYFGHNMAEGHDRLARAIFNAFPAPLLRARFERQDRWRLASVRAIGLAEVPAGHHEFLVRQAERYLRRSPRRAREAPASRFDLAILHDPDEAMPPSDRRALQRFVEAGEQVGIRCELIDKSDAGRIAEFDALFIRETTAVNHHTYRMARRAAAEGMVVIDDPQSIVRCTNKVFLAETLSRARLPTPRTLVLTRDNAEEGIRSLGLPCVLKQPDSAFSAGVCRVDTEEALEDALRTQFERTELIVAQAYVPTQFDWRIGVLAGQPLFACRYGMAPGHWQIVNHGRSGRGRFGSYETLAVEQAPAQVVDLAVRAAGLMGQGLYGVDLKVVDGRPLVIEVNDNPNIDSGVEDRVLGMALYQRIMQHFFWKLEAR
ncbi:MAG: ribosomal protein S6 modification protein [Phycisphaerales bacterium]|nr:MAG: ribosomal protein S6 modification protein [Phycisphaerales bacterium]